MNIDELLDENGRPYVMIDGRRFVLAEGEPVEVSDVEYEGPLPEIFQRLGNPPRSVSLATKIVLLLANGHAPYTGLIAGQDPVRQHGAGLPNKSVALLFTPVFFFLFLAEVVILFYSIFVHDLIPFS